MYIHLIRKRKCKSPLSIIQTSNHTLSKITFDLVCPSFNSHIYVSRKQNIYKKQIAFTVISDSRAVT